MDDLDDCAELAVQLAVRELRDLTGGATRREVGPDLLEGEDHGIDWGIAGWEVLTDREGSMS